MDPKDESRRGNTLDLNRNQNLGTAHPSVEITKCISFQKFRYDKRTGKKYQDKDFMELKLSNLNGKIVSVIIMCIDADDHNLIHPNGLMGKNCQYGIYEKTYVIKEADEEIRIPYIRIDRFKTRSFKEDDLKRVLEKRAKCLPHPFQERCLSQCNKKCTLARWFNTTDVRFAVIVSYQGAYPNSPIFAISHVVGDASEKTSLGIHKLSQDLIPASGSLIDIFTTEKGPKVEGDKFSVYITCGDWKSDTITVSAADILYGKVISYQVPSFVPCPNTPSLINATLHLECRERSQFCSYNFTYSSYGGAVIPKVFPKECERKRTHPDQFDETIPERSNAKRRKIPCTTAELDIGVENHNQRTFFHTKSTAGVSSINSDLNTGQLDYNSIVSNPNFPHRAGWNVQKNNSPFWDRHQVSGHSARSHLTKVVPATTINSEIPGVRENRLPTERQHDLDLNTKQSHQSSNSVQPLDDRRPTNEGIQKEIPNNGCLLQQVSHDFQTPDPTSFCFTTPSLYDNNLPKTSRPSWEHKPPEEKLTATSHSHIKGTPLSTLGVLELAIDLENNPPKCR